MRILGPIVQAFVEAMLDVQHDLPPRRAVGAELVGDHALRRETLLLQQPCQQAL